MSLNCKIAETALSKNRLKFRKSEKSAVTLLLWNQNTCSNLQIYLWVLPTLNTLIGRSMTT